MIEKMKFLTITGPKDDIDRVADVYLSKYEMHLENALVELNDTDQLYPFVDSNQYKDANEHAQKMLSILSSDNIKPVGVFADPADAASYIEELYSNMKSLDEKVLELKKQKAEISDVLQQIMPFRVLNCNLKPFMDSKFIKFRYGRVPHEFFNNFLKYEYEQLNVLFFESSSDENYVWGMYFVPVEYADKIDAIFSSMHFERIFLKEEYEGTPQEVFQNYVVKLKELSTEIKATKSEIKKQLNDVAGRLVTAKSVLDRYNANRSIRKLAACTRDKNIVTDETHNVFYILCGWMTRKDAKKFLAEIEKDPQIFCISEDGEISSETIPPTKLKNLGIFKPFEMFVGLYGLPAYNEIDPTIFIALTYSFLFGMMFGDVGQGACLIVGGLFFYKFKKMALGGILALAGLFSTVFGFMYGSIFGFEDWIDCIWTRPIEDTMTVLIVAIAFGIGLNVIAMIVNIVNAIKAKDKGKLLFSTNGIAGLVFYVFAISCALCFVLGYTLPGTIILILGFGVPVLCIFLQEPLAKLVERKKKIIEGGKVMFFVEAFFELFEIMLSYITNSLSFVRVGAFALSHAGMMSVVLMLAGAHDGTPNIPVIILGNLFVACLEGLVVGIQVLRLEYYEMFSRFYSGTGRKFVPFKSRKL